MHYDVLKRSAPSDKTLPVLNRLKANIVRLQNIRLQKILEDNSNADNPDGEQPTIHHTLQTKRRRAERTIYCLRDEGQIHKTQSGIAQTLTKFIRKMCDRIEADDASVKTLMEVVRCDLHTSYGGTFDSPFQPTEIHEAIQAGDGKRHLGLTG